jgi:hypothetical protein
MDNDINQFIIQFNRIENKIIKHMYKKYNVEEKKKISLEDFKKQIIGIKRPRIIYQNDITKKELEQIQKANVEYYVLKKQLKMGEINHINEKTDFGYPDILRCNFIINHKNNFIRCKNRIFETSECCLKHYKKENFYYEKYLQICKELSNIDNNK